ncbi:MAG: hydroxyethylthiazole kinase [Candidatus Omnitrophota bacterium]
MDIYSILEKVRSKKPLIHHLTNWVTIYDCANIVKVFGASPVMAHAKEEVSDMVKLASSLVLNIGTLTPDFIEAMILAGKGANKKGIPIILDVCGAGATSLRNGKCKKLIKELKIGIIKGNASEIANIAGENIQTKGVDSSKVEKDLVELAKSLAKKEKNVVVITGEEDIVSDGENTYIIKNGCEVMSHIVGTGCMAASVIGTFAAVEKDLAKASVAGLVCYEIAAELACKESSGPGTFKEKLFDNIFRLNKENIEKMKKIS